MTEPTPETKPNGDGRHVGPSATLPPSDNPDPFDPARFRIRQDFASTAAVTSELTEIAVGKPGKQEFIRVHPSPDYRLDAAIVDYERTIYLVVPGLANGPLRDQVTGVTLFTTQNTQRVTYLWPVSLPKDGRANSWTDSARELAAKAMVETLQLKANHNPKAQRYDAIVPRGKPPEPEWPAVPFCALLRLAFGERVIDTLEHPVARRLLGVTFD
jgi:hypothetical protein